MYCGVILVSDKMTVSVATGNVEYHPLCHGCVGALNLILSKGM